MYLTKSSRSGRGVWTDFIWLSIGTYGDELLGSAKCGQFLD